MLDGEAETLSGEWSGCESLPRPSLKMQPAPTRSLASKVRASVLARRARLCQAGSRTRFGGAGLAVALGLVVHVELTKKEREDAQCKKGRCHETPASHAGVW